MRKINIIADEKIPFLKEVFSDIGSLTIVPSREIDNVTIRNYDVILVRSVTKINEELLHNSRIKIVGSMTSGIDHVDRNYLRKNKIKFIYAPGSNANSVAEYVIASLLTLAKKRGIQLHRKTMGIIGVGNIGGIVAQMCRALGMNVLLNDPPKFNKTKKRELISFKNLSDADIVTIHVPLTFTGKYKTYRMVDDDFFKQMKTNAILINTSRGAVIDELALIRHFRKLGGLILDVWNNEPDINLHLLKLADIATPHIAGYSLDGKLNATTAVYRKLCQYIGEKPKITKTRLLPKLEKEIIPCTKYRKTQDIVCQIVLEAYDPLMDTSALKELLKIDKQKNRGFFEALRNNYAERREFSNYRVRLNMKNYMLYTKLSKILNALGFKTIT
ncbi:MAG: 4-phosphoerythronate dehydrogenase [bacterium]